MLGNYSVMDFTLIFLVLLEIVLLGGIAGRKLDTHAIKDRIGQSQAVRERNASFYHSVVIFGILSIAAGYAMSLAASWTWQFNEDAKDGLNPGILSAGSIIICFEVVLILIAISHERGILLSTADVRLALSRVKQEGDRYNQTEFTGLVTLLEEIKENNIAFRAKNRLSTQFSKKYEALYSYDKEVVGGQDLVMLSRRRLTILLWCKYIFCLHGFIWRPFRTFSAISLALFLLAALGVSSCFSVKTFFIFLIVVFVVATTYLVDAKNALLKTAKSQVLLRAQIAICERLVADIGLLSPAPIYTVSHRIGKWDISRRE